MSSTGGFVIALDGPDGVGKSTQVALLAEYFKAQGQVVHTTRSSGGTAIGEALREVSLSNNPRPAETDLYISLAMGAALAEDIQARKAAGETIIIDRSPLAMLAYNGYGSQLADKDQALAACEKLFHDWHIDRLIFLHAPNDILLQRRAERGTHDYFEQQKQDFHDRVNEGYGAGLAFLEQHHELGAKITSLDASPDVETLHKQIVSRLEND